MFISPTQPKKIKNKTAGFSLVELMASISIIVLITGVVMTKYSSFSSVVILKSQAYELALDIREAQVFGVSTSRAGRNYRGAYGIYIDLSNRNSYILFQDIDIPGNKNFRYDANEKIGDPYSIDKRFLISEICITTSSGERCRGGNSRKTSIAFKRPDFDAKMWSNIDSSPDQVRIVIASRDNPGMSRSVIIYSSGQISVK